MKRIMVFLMGLILISLACSKKSTKQDDPTYSIDGIILNQSGLPASNLFVEITDSKNTIHSGYTNQDGIYSVSGINAGAASVELSSYEIIIADLPRFIEKDTVININSNEVLNMSIQEFHTVFHDTGNVTQRWLLYGGVVNDGQKYIFEDYWLEDDYMLSSSFPIPANADPNNIGFIIRGKSAPYGMSYMDVYIYVNNNLQDLYWSGPYGSTWFYHMYSLDQFPQVCGNNIRLCLWFTEDTAPYIYVDEIWIYNY
ncbi:MAG: carboxypeptidase regulatory-like domain-containing protein [candidate division Zixibacteria bacterium]|nr:carboxypeptidase regulatory-like domain-containing protein [candidate division Zixibacteria bacterium]